MSTTYPELFVIRHGQTLWNVEGRHQGRLDSRLTATGTEQARRMGTMLLKRVKDRRDMTAVTSPQGRAHSTAQIAMAPLGWPVTVDDRLCETSFGAWEGLTLDEIRQNWPQQAAFGEDNPLEWNFKSPGGESLTDLQSRADSFLGDLTGPAIVFTHGIFSRVLRARWLGLTDEGMLALPGGQGVIFHLCPDHGHQLIEK